MDRKLQDAVTDSPSRLDRFKETARALGCDEDEAAFKAKLAMIARQKPRDEPGLPQSNNIDESK